MLVLVLAFENLPTAYILALHRHYRRPLRPQENLVQLAGNQGGGPVSRCFVLLLFGLIAPWHVFAAMLLQGVSRALEDPARRTAIFDIVGERRVVNALSIDSMSHTVGRMIGPFVGGFLVEHVAYLWPPLRRLHLDLCPDRGHAHGIPWRWQSGCASPRWNGKGGWNPSGTAWASVVRAAFNHRQLMGMLFITIMINGLTFRPASSCRPLGGIIWRSAKP